MARTDLTGKPICITGGSSGIGRATALACARAGMPVVVSARREDRLADVVAEIRALGGRAVASPGDVTDRAAMDAMVDRCVAEFGSVYAVFANAGYGVDLPVHKTDEPTMREMFETNFWGTMHTIWAALPRMLEAGSGHIVICSSTIAKIALPGCGAYCATKAAQNMIGRAMNVELAHRGVRTTTVHPVGTRTEFFRIAHEKSNTDHPTLDQHAPGWAMQPPEAVARGVVGALRRHTPEVWPSWSWAVRLALGVTHAFPRLADVGTKRLVHRDW
jgi:NAD(P)-dependent dehydrogenase (short-subunit alcohol dehydrogenase family)